MSSSGSGERRRFFRLRYPTAERPTLQFDNVEFAVVELSESGVRVHLSSSQLFDGKSVIGWIRFVEADAIPVEGFVLRTEGDEATVQLSQGISLKRMLEEQRRLIQLYPFLFERSENDSNLE